MTRLTHIGVGLLCLLALTGAAVGQSAAFTFTTTAGDTQAGSDVTVAFTYENTGNASQTAVVNVTSVPDGWAVTDRSNDGGTWNGGDQTWLFLTVPSGSSVSPSLTLSVPADASGTYNVTAIGATNDAEQSSTVTLTLGSEQSTGTETGGAATETDASTEAPTTDESMTDASTPDNTAEPTATTGGSGDGFGVVVTGLAAMCLALVARRQR